MSDVQHQKAACDSDLTTLDLNLKVSAICESKPYKRKKVLAWLDQNVPSKRLQHILRVEEMAIQLAHHYHLNVEKAAQAGLMHDLAKCFKAKKLLQLAEQAGLTIDAVFAANPHLLHADVGAIVAQQEFGIEDEAVLDAIRNHTLGSADMSPLSCVVFLADSLEPGRGDTPELHQLREACWEDLHKAVWLTSEYTLKHLFDSQHLIHPRAVMTRNWAMQQTMQRGRSHG
jgi:predicted HD superfamily hydrolase involved in NAD metabolism